MRTKNRGERILLRIASRKTLPWVKKPKYPGFRKIAASNPKIRALAMVAKKRRMTEMSALLPYTSSPANPMIYPKSVKVKLDRPSIPPDNISIINPTIKPIIWPLIGPNKNAAKQKSMNTKSGLTLLTVSLAYMFVD